MINAGKKSLTIFVAFADDSAYTSTDNVKRAQVAMANNEYLVTADVVSPGRYSSAGDWRP